MRIFTFLETPSCTYVKDSDLRKPSKDRADRFLQHLEPLKAALEAYCRRGVHDSNAVEDVLQEAVGNAYRDFHKYAEGTNFRAWMFRYLNLEIYSGNRMFHRQRSEVLSEEPTIEDLWEQVIDEPVIEQLLEKSEIVLDHCDAWGHGVVKWVANSRLITHHS